MNEKVKQQNQNIQKLLGVVLSIFSPVKYSDSENLQPLLICLLINVVV